MVLKVPMNIEHGILTLNESRLRAVLEEQKPKDTGSPPNIKYTVHTQF